jgi:hypothetical protein
VRSDLGADITKEARWRKACLGKEEERSKM